MCPDKQLHSAYFDNEIPSPWKEKFEAHVNSCASCQKKLETYSKIREAFLEQPIPVVDEKASFERLAQKINAVKRIPAERRQTRYSVPVKSAIAAAFICIALPSAYILGKNDALSKPNTAAPVYAVSGQNVGAFGVSFPQERQIFYSLNEFDPAVNVGYLPGGFVNSVVTPNSTEFFAGDGGVTDDRIIYIKLPKVSDFTVINEVAKPISAGSAFRSVGN